MQLRKALFVAFVATALQYALPAETDAEIASLKARLDAQQRELDQVRQQVDKQLQQQLEAINRRFDDAAASMNKLLALVGIFGALSSAFAFTTWFKGRSDYLTERKGQEALVNQQVRLGDELMGRSKELVDHQIESIANLRNVISLVAESFSLQVKREKGLEEFTELAADLNEHYKASYARARDGILSLNVTRMGWTTLTMAQYRIAARARAEFRAIPERYLRREQEERPLEFASVCQRIGTSAFYANDIEYAQELLDRAWNTYKTFEDSKGTFPEDYRLPRATTAFFLGLIAKSWIGEGQELAKALNEARKWIGAAQDLINGDKERARTEFQIPVTHAEVLSYIESTRNDARQVLGDIGIYDKNAIITRLERVATRDDNQQRLLARAYLIRGNVEQAVGRDPKDYYDRARQHDPEYAYTTLALASATKETEERRVLFTAGLDALKPLLDKPEVTAMALALAWATIATHELNRTAERDKYLQRLQNIQATGSINAGDRQPLFFNPLSKNLCRLNELLESISEYVTKVEKEATRHSEQENRRLEE
ncbi:MAG: hypothetical protein JST93_03165 [Acidobacteria bacterium]|nr:hypothetical protein [Acidobacteriota bacterium]